MLDGIRVFLCFMDHLQERLRKELASEQIVSAALLEVLKGEVVRPAPEACDSKVVGLTLSRLSHLRHLFSSRVC